MTLLFYSFSSVFSSLSPPGINATVLGMKLPITSFFSFFFPARDRCGVGVCFVMSELLMDRIDGLDQSAVS